MSLTGRDRPTTVSVPRRVLDLQIGRMRQLPRTYSMEPFSTGSVRNIPQDSEDLSMAFTQVRCILGDMEGYPPFVDSSGFVTLSGVGVSPYYSEIVGSWSG